jgi:hypothetical protein
MSDIRQTSTAMQRLVDRIFMVTNQHIDLLIAFPWQHMNTTVEKNCHQQTPRVVIQPPQATADQSLQ